MKMYNKLFLCALLLLGLIGCERKPVRTVKILTSTFYDCSTKTIGNEFIPVSYLEISDTGTVKLRMGHPYSKIMIYYSIATDDSVKQKILNLACNDSLFEPYPSDANKFPPNKELFNIELRKDSTIKRCSFYQYGSNKQQQLLIKEFYKLSREVEYKYVPSNNPPDISKFVMEIKRNLPSGVGAPPPLRSKIVSK